jgi:DNA helicase-2/ATP-dependent DNA helicase PcrA
VRPVDLLDEAGLLALVAGETAGEHLPEPPDDDLPPPPEDEPPGDELPEDVLLEYPELG